MKITRLHRGYRIRLSDSEFAALEDLCIRGQGEFEGLEPHEWKDVEPEIVRGLRTITGQGSWQIDDRRK